MGKIIDINERTLEQERQDLKQTSRVVRIEAICFAIAIFSILTAGAIKYAETSVSRFCTVFNFLALPFETAAIVIVVKHVMALFRELEQSDTPFRYPIADKMKGLANAVIIAGLLIGVPQTVVQVVDSFVVKSSSLIASGSIILLGAMFLGGIIMAVSYVLALGCKLQQESDETL